MTGASKNTIVKLLADAGQACAAYQDANLRGLPCKRLQVDEIWSFVYAKDKNVPTAKAALKDAGSMWTRTAICADTKLIPSFYVGSRNARYSPAECTGTTVGVVTGRPDKNHISTSYAERASARRGTRTLA